METSSHGIVLCLIFIACLYTYIQFIHPDGFKPSFMFQNDQIISNKSTINKTSHEDVLETALSKAATDNKTLIIAVVNKAYVEGDNQKQMLDLFLEGFWVGEGTRGLINHLLLVAVDQESFERCKFLRLQCFKLETDGVDFVGEKVYMSEDFINMMWRRTLFLGEVLKRGYSFIFTDTDVLWLRNPFHRLSNDQSIDFQISTDNFNGNPRSQANPINTGFYMVRSNNKTISLFEAWYARKDQSQGMKEQDVLQKMLSKDGVFEELNVTVRFLDTLCFSGFCQDSKDFRAVASVHANCCRTISAKVVDLMAVIRDWKRFRSSISESSSSSDQMASWKWSKHTACIHSWL
ncbi:hypothetical protein TIFTF001_010319 [Ficus carica]|uniref:Nucleotide-diphospho-sugar transferase domain-containing protein n=1 Tax=Ficus carica TaxID=3494 RepID=A0AA88AIW2_FICCA|nr:hypothetical protein TIFTF001_010319 [Ficus carica]